MNEILFNIYTNLWQLRNKIINIVRVKSHVGFDRNLLAYYLVKAVIETGLFDEEIYIPKPVSFLKTFYKSNIIRLNVYGYVYSFSGE